MLELNHVMISLYKRTSETFEQYGFSPVFPEGVKANEVPVKKRGEDSCFIDFAGASGKLRLLYSDNKIFLLLGATDAPDDDDSAFKRLSAMLMVLEEYGDNDIKSAANEICDTLTDNFGVKELAKKNRKMPATVSKASVRSGTMSYDPLTLASRLVGIYAPLKEEMKRNIDEYGEFLPEDFFVNHANAYIKETIKTNEPKAMKRLFNQLTEIFDNGMNETQNLIAVTVLGSVENDPVLMKNMLPYLSDSMVEPVVEVNKILGKSKSARMRLENPPKYKPKKKKKSKFTSALGN